MIRVSSKIALVFFPALLAMTALANQPGEQARSKTQPAASDSPSSENEDADATVLAFVKEHQPELADLISFLKKNKSRDYQEAMRESRKVRDRLVSIKDRDPDLYAVELDIWKNAAQIRLLAASASAKSNKLSRADHARLEELVKHENALTVKRLVIEKARLEARVNQLSQQLSRRQDQADSVVSKAMKTWETRIERSGARPKKKEQSTP